MAFYIRKAFKTGPVRLNLSKGGLGLSAGITGARVGINSRGTYVHGGRYGLYYREYLDSGKTSGAGRKRRSRSGRDAPHHGPVTLFRDTGVTYSGRSSELQKGARKEPELPSPGLTDLPFKIAFAATLAFYLLSFGENMEWLVVAAIITGTAALGWLGWNSYWKRRAVNVLKTSAKKTESDKSFTAEEIPPGETMPARWKKWLHLHLHAVIGELAMREEEIDTLQTLQLLDRHLPADKGLVGRIRASVLGNLFDEMLEDHLLSEEEERALRRLMEQLNLPETLIAPELERLDHYSRIREQMERPLQEIDPGIPLVRGEAAYEQFETARLLNERVLHRFQRDNVQYRELGYEVDMEGRLIITDRRLLLIERGSREYRLNRLVDITADPEAGIVEITLSNRKSPVIITTEEPLVFAARLEKVVEM